MLLPHYTHEPPQEPVISHWTRLRRQRPHTPVVHLEHHHHVVYLTRHCWRGELHELVDDQRAARNALDLDRLVRPVRGQDVAIRFDLYGDDADHARKWRESRQHEDVAAEVDIQPVVGGRLEVEINPPGDLHQRASRAAPNIDVLTHVLAVRTGPCRDVDVQPCPVLRTGQRTVVLGNGRKRVQHAIVRSGRLAAKDPSTLQEMRESLGAIDPDIPWRRRNQREKSFLGEGDLLELIVEVWIAALATCCEREVDLRQSAVVGG